MRFIFPALVGFQAPTAFIVSGHTKLDRWDVVKLQWFWQCGEWMCQMLAGYLALVTAALFTGAAFYISFAEQPARLGLDDHALLTQWKPAYKRGLIMQAPLAILGFALGIVAWWFTGHVMFFIGGVFLFANLPWTLFGILPTNRVLMATEPQAAGPESRALIVKWNRLHTVRTVLGCLAILSFLNAL